MTPGHGRRARDGEADARSGLLPASPAPVAGEFVIDRLSLYDYALKANVAA